MTTEAKKCIRATGIVMACLLAVGGGAIWRDRLELGGPDQVSQLELPNLVAENSNATALPETKFFDDMMELLKRKYVDPITDDTKLADGAVRGMVASLGDPNSLYMDADQYRVYSNVRMGKYEGIGADLVLAKDRPHAKVQTGGPDSADDNTRFPLLTIAAVVPGGAADRAGLRPGDWTEFVDGHWVPNSPAFDRLEALAEAVKNKKATTDEFFKVRRQLRAQADKYIVAIKARDRLMMGTAGTVDTVWIRGDKPIKVTLARGSWKMPGFEVRPDASIRLPFLAGSADKLRQALSGKTEATLDLRSNVDGDFDAMLACLKVVAPNGTYGFLTTQKNEKPTALTISDGASNRIKLTLLVDRTTSGAAEIFALALSSRGVAKLEGPEMAGNRSVVHWYELPDKAGYTLVTGEYDSNAPTGVLANSSPANRELAPSAPPIIRKGNPDMVPPVTGAKR